MQENCKDCVLTSAAVLNFFGIQLQVEMAIDLQGKIFKQRKQNSNSQKIARIAPMWTKFVGNNRRYEIYHFEVLQATQLQKT